MKVKTIINPNQWLEVINREEVPEQKTVRYTLQDGTKVLRSQVLDFLYDEELGGLDQALKTDS